MIDDVYIMDYDVIIDYYDYYQGTLQNRDFVTCPGNK